MEQKVISSKLKSRMAAAAKSKSERVHVISRLDGWVVKKEGNKKASSAVIKTQKDAISIANALKSSGKVSEVIVHQKDGKIRK